MRIWHRELLPYLPDAQFRGQLRELVAIMHEWRDRGKTNHVLINKVMDFPKSHLSSYFTIYSCEFSYRYRKEVSERISQEFREFGGETHVVHPFSPDWHDRVYLDICMMNLFEKHVYGSGSSRITDMEWEKLEGGYKRITGRYFFV